jgi:2-(3-amino-3-carboxypropyl)histidine synthase
MKTMFVPAFSKVRLKKELLNQVEKAVEKYKNIGIVSIVQYMLQQQNLHDFLEIKGKKVFTGYGKHSNYKGQILVCDVAAADKIKTDVECFIYLGTGKFHPTMVAAKTEKPVIVADPLTSVVSEISERDVHQYNVRKVIMRDKLKHAKKVGIIVSTKPGQANLGRARMIRNSLIKKGKNAYIFIAETLIPEELINFPDIDMWVNTSCAGLFYDSERFDRPIINMEDLE